MFQAGDKSKTAGKDKERSKKRKKITSTCTSTTDDDVSPHPKSKKTSCTGYKGYVTVPYEAYQEKDIFKTTPEHGKRMPKSKKPLDL